MITVAGVAVFFVNMFWSLAAGKKAPDNPWGEGATTLEWTLSEPAAVPPIFDAAADRLGRRTAQRAKRPGLAPASGAFLWRGGCRLLHPLGLDDLDRRVEHLALHRALRPWSARPARRRSCFTTSMPSIDMAEGREAVGSPPGRSASKPGMSATQDEEVGCARCPAPALAMEIAPATLLEAGLRGRLVRDRLEQLARVAA